MLRPYVTRCSPLFYPFQPRIRPIRPAHFRAGLSLEHDDIGLEIEPPLEEARPDAVDVDGNVLLFEVPDLLYGEAARDDDLDVLKTIGIQRAAHVPHQLRIHAGGLERPHLRND